MGKGPDVDEEDLEQVNRLFATATAMLEDTIEVAVAGQSPRLTPSQLADGCRRLQALAQAIAVIAEAATIIANRALTKTRNGRNAAPERTGLPRQSKHALVT